MPPTAEKMKFYIRISSVNVSKSAVSYRFTEEILNGKLHFSCGRLYLVINCLIVPFETLHSPTMKSNLIQNIECLRFAAWKPKSGQRWFV